MAFTMPQVKFINLLGFFAALAFATAAAPASAHNVPGSAATAISEESEIATGMVVRSIKEHMLPLRNQAAQGGVFISTSGRIEGAGFSSGGGLPLSFSYDYRDLNTDRLDGNLAIGTLFLGKELNGETLIFGGLIAERLDSDTPYNSGTVKADGLGIALGIDHRISNRFYLTGIIGVMKMDYDVTRSSGAVTGSFGARRSFVDLSGDYILQTDPAEVTLGFGLLYMRQKNDAYTENGGGAVAAFTNDQLSARLSARSLWGRPGEIRPYVQAEAWARLAGSFGLPAVLDPGDDRDWGGRLAVGLQQSGAGSGFDLGLGSNFGEGGFEGLDARFSYSLRF